MENVTKEEFLKQLEDSRLSLSRFTRAMARDYDDAKDLMSETILKAYEGYEKLVNKQAFQSYLFTIASRLHKRRIWRNKLFIPFSSTTHQDYQSVNPNAEVNLDIEILYKALNKLELKKREAITLFEISGFSLEEIADIQGGSVSGVKSRLKRGREELAKLLKVKDEPKFFLHNINENTKQTKSVDGLYTAKVKL